MRRTTRATDLGAKRRDRWLEKLLGLVRPVARTVARRRRLYRIWLGERSPSPARYVQFLEWLLDDMWKDAEVGFKILRASALGQRAAYGSAQMKGRVRAQYQAEVDRLRTDHPSWSKNSVSQHAAKRFKVSAKTISRYTSDKGPRKS